MLNSSFVLVVDDEAEMRDAVALVLSAEGHRIFRAKDGVEALAVLDSLPADADCVVVTDLHMPRLDGGQLAMRIRTRPRSWRVRILLMGNDATIADRRGSDAFMDKPFWPESLRTTVRSLFDSLEDVAKDVALDKSIEKPALQHAS